MVALEEGPVEDVWFRAFMAAMLISAAMVAEEDHAEDEDEDEDEVVVLVALLSSIVCELGALLTATALLAVTMGLADAFAASLNRVLSLRGDTSGALEPRVLVQCSSSSESQLPWLALLAALSESTLPLRLSSSVLRLCRWCVGAATVGTVSVMLRPP